jgi:GNAT superfamily N-acetyltransferase
MRIRPAKADDALILAEILVAGWKWAYQGIISDEELASLDVSARMRRFRDQLDPEILFLVAVDESDCPIGFAIESRPPQLEQFDCEIGGLYVDPKSTRGGVGRALVTSMVQTFRQRGARSMGIHTLLLNRIGRGFYESIGGSPVLEDTWRSYGAVWYAWDDLSIF